MDLVKQLREFNRKGIMEISIPNNGIGDLGIREVINLLMVDYASKWAADNNLPGGVDVEEVVHGVGHEWLTKTGTFPKRIAKAWKKAAGYKLDQPLLSKIGSAASTYCEKQSRYYVDFTQSFDWKAGDYGDSGSCFWGCHAAAREAMDNAGYWAMRFYSGPSPETGMARCWVAPVVVGTEPCLMLFNAYPSSFSLIKMGRILSTMLGTYYRHGIDLSNYGDNCGTLYINGGTGLAVGPESAVSGLDKFDLRCDTPDEDDRHTCTACGERVNADEAFTYDDEYYCQSCFNDRFYYCTKCDETYPTDDITEVDGQYMCENCLGRYAEKCHECDEYHLNTTMTVVEYEGDTIYLCDDCDGDFMDRHTLCYECGEYFDGRGNEVEHDGEDMTLCSNCFNDFTARHYHCKECGKWFNSNEAHHVEDDNAYCPDCYETMREDEENEHEEDTGLDKAEHCEAVATASAA